MPATFMRGISTGTLTMARMKPKASATPIAPPQIDSKIDSRSNWRTMAARLAPRAVRRANSAPRRDPCATSRPPTLAHTSNRTSETAPNRMRRAGRVSPVMCVSSGSTSAEVKCLLFSGYWRARLSAMMLRSALACSTVTPGRSLPITPRPSNPRCWVGDSCLRRHRQEKARERGRDCRSGRESARHDAGDGERVTIDDDGIADDIGGSAELVLPECIAQHDRAVAGLLIVLLSIWPSMGAAPSTAKKFAETVCTSRRCDSPSSSMFTVPDE